jgi:tetratricopeptide (TPR) repeat protein
VFVSSTWLDLQPERKAVELALQRMRETKLIGMEYFGSRDDTAREVSLAEVDRSHFYIGIFGARYGSGITEAEYRRAREKGIPRRIYFKEDATVTADQGEMDAAKAVKLAALKEELMRDLAVVKFSNPDNLAALITADFHNWLVEHFETSRDAMSQQMPWNLPKPATRFFGRKQDIENTAHLLSKRRRIAITGSGGIGKTAFAREVLVSLCPSRSNPGCAPAGIVSHDYYIGHRHDEVLDGLLKQLRQEDVPVTQRESTLSALLANTDLLLYLEGCERASDLTRLLNLASGCRILLTTRNPLSIADALPIALPPLDEQSAADLIEWHRQIPGEETSKPTAEAALKDHADLLLLARALGGHPLACQRAGITLRDDLISPSELLAAKPAENPERLGEDDHEHTSLWWLLEMAAERLERRFMPSAQRPSDGIALWHLLGLCANAPIPLDFLNGFPLMPPRRLLECLKELQRVGIAEPLEMPIALFGKSKAGWRLTHPLLNTWAARGLPKHRSKLNGFFPLLRKLWVELMSQAQSQRVVPGGETGFALCAPHWEALIEHITFTSGHNHASDSLEQRFLAEFAMRHGRHELAEQLARETLKASESIHGEFHEWTSSACNMLATILRETHRFEEAVEIGRRALAIAEKLYEPDDTQLATILDTLGVALRHNDNAIEAKQIIERALRIFRAKFGDEHPDTITCLSNLALCLDSLGQCAAAEATLWEVLNADLKLYGSGHPEVAKDRYNLAAQLETNGKLKEAEEQIREALNVYPRTLGEKHPEVAALVDRLARLYERQKRFAEAEQLHREAFDLHCATPGPDSVFLREAHAAISKRMFECGNYNEANVHSEAILAIDERKHGTGSPLICETLAHVATMAYKTGSFARAESLARRGLSINDSAGQASPSDVIDFLGILGNVLFETGRIDEGWRHFEQGIRLAEKEYGESDLRTGRYLASISWENKSRAFLERLLLLCRRTLAIAEAHDGEAGNHLTRARRNLGLLLVKLDQWEEAIPFLQQVIGMEPGDPAENLIEDAHLMLNLSACLFQTGKSAKALPQIKRVLEVFALDLAQNQEVHSLFPLACNYYVHICSALAIEEHLTFAEFSQILQKSGVTEASYSLLMAKLDSKN